MTSIASTDSTTTIAMTEQQDKQAQQQEEHCDASTSPTTVVDVVKDDPAATSPSMRFLNKMLPRSSKSVSKLIEKALSMVDTNEGDYDDDGTDSTDEITLSEHSGNSFFSSSLHAVAEEEPGAHADHAHNDECDYYEHEQQQQDDDDFLQEEEQAYLQQQQQLQEEQHRRHHRNCRRRHHRNDDNQRRIHFDFEATHVVESDLEGGLTEEDIANAWYDDDEWNDMYYVHDYEMADAEHAYQWQDDLMNVVLMCQQVGRMPAGRALEHSIICLAQPDASAQRGFEAEFMPFLVECRDRHRAQVLDFYDRIQPKHISPELKDRLVASRSIQFSQTHNYFAQIIGQVDELASLDPEDDDEFDLYPSGH
eukprot:CAMPEP_0113458728 /NCGR_PEP_ID=MMETSP0014_2-20120614/10073_1 /TAXON_ID=2857 /ORGANISM="Nitzschia sp." /LENGTH=364 /DNA_ID=CAMNT_0000350263 /DNA_START=97 /DNA_END=1191 /DNA_ORIENTATION=- /assembly_acc=CAM_ASM_000159